MYQIRILPSGSSHKHPLSLSLEFELEMDFKFELELKLEFCTPKKAHLHNRIDVAPSEVYLLDRAGERPV